MIFYRAVVALTVLPCFAAYLQTVRPALFPPYLQHAHSSSSSSSSSAAAPTSTTTLPEMLVNTIMNSPLKGPIVSVARNTMVSTALKAGLPWGALAARLVTELGGVEAIESAALAITSGSAAPTPSTITVPPYYQQAFHGYPLGNLEYLAGIEQEIAGKAVGARNFPAEGLGGEAVLRGCYAREVESLCGNSLFEAAAGGVVLDMGCGSGTSTRQLARMFPKATKVIGMDLSPYMLLVGRYLQTGKARAWWVDPVTEESCDRIELLYGNIEETGLASGSCDVVSLSLVLHELPEATSLRVLKEAYRLLKPGGVLCIMEMDPQSPGYVKLRANPALFSILRSTEPWLAEYFSLAPVLPAALLDAGFATVKVSAATGRHFCMAATKGGLVDVRPCDAERLRQDKHIANSLDTNTRG